MSSFGGSQAPTLMNLPPPRPVMPGANSAFQQFMFGGGGGSTSPFSGGGTGRTSIAGGPNLVVPRTGAGSTGGAFGAAGSTLEGMASGVDIQPMIDTLVKASQNQYKTGAAQIQNSFAASGMGMSTDLMKSLSDYNVNFGAQQDQAVSQLIMQGKGLQLGAAQELFETGSNAALNYAPSAQVVGGAANSNLGSAAVQGGSEIGSTLITLAALGFL